MMTRDLGVWTYENSALVLIDYQNEMFETIRSETSVALAELNVRFLARTARALDMPIVLSPVGVKYGINGPTQAAILADLPGIEPIDRTSMNAWHGFVTNVGGFNAATQALKASGAFLTERLGSTAE